MENPGGSVDTSPKVDTEKPSDNDPKYDSWKGANQKYKTRRSGPIKFAIPKLTVICTGLSVFIYELGPNKTNEYIKTTLDKEEYEARTYGKEVIKINQCAGYQIERFYQAIIPHYGSMAVINAH